jgi:hypothetical protein
MVRKITARNRQLPLAAIDIGHQIINSRRVRAAMV